MLVGTKHALGIHMVIFYIDFTNPTFLLEGVHLKQQLNY